MTQHIIYVFNNYLLASWFFICSFSVVFCQCIKEQFFSLKSFFPQKYFPMFRHVKQMKYGAINRLPVPSVSIMHLKERKFQQIFRDAL